MFAIPFHSIPDIFPVIVTCLSHHVPNFVEGECDSLYATHVMQLSFKIV